MRVVAGRKICTCFALNLAYSVDILERIYVSRHYVSEDPNMKRFIVPAAVLLLIMTVTAARADVTMPGVFGDNMVLQRDSEVPVWGTAQPGEDIAVRIGVWTAVTKAGSDGTWMVRMSPMPWGGPVTLTVEGRNTLTFRNVMIGDVWICSGQSNMAWTVANSNNPEYEIGRARYPDIRLFQVERTIAMEPLDDVAVDIPWSELHAEADKLEHSISKDVEDRLISTLEDPPSCPHGNPMPGQESISNDWQDLTSFGIGDICVIKRIHEWLESDPEMMKYLEENHVVPGKTAKIISHSKSNNLIEISIEKRTTSIESDIAEKIFASTT